MGSSDWIRVTKAQKCQVCGKPDWCLISQDGSASICQRVPSEKRVGDAGWLHRHGDLFVAPTPPPVELEIPDVAPPGWSEAVDDCHNCMEEYQWRFLSQQTGCNIKSLQSIRAGWSAVRQAYTFPMRNGKREVCGVRLRFPNGRKSSVKGSRNGLFVSPDTDLSTKRVYVCEGPTDTAALISIGVVAVGRPSCNSGSKYLAELLPFGPELVVVADKDKPGRDGAKLIATQLSKTKGTVKVIEPLKGGDANEWVQQGCSQFIIDVVSDQAKAIR